jgi:transposase
LEEVPGDESKKNDVLVAQRRDEIKAYIHTHQEEIARGERIVLFVDECFVCWGDACGYVWGPRNERVNVPIGNVRMRQAYYGAVDMVSGMTHYVPYDKADALSTTDFLRDLQWRFPHTKLTIIWDNASHHKAGTVREYLAQVNADRPEQDWTITCLWFAPHDPSQNPIEDIWNQAKAWVRQQWANLTSFLDVTTAFEQFLAGRTFDFPKLHRYGPDVRVT